MNKPYPKNGPANVITYQVPGPAGSVQLVTFMPWARATKQCRTEIIIPADASREFVRNVCPQRTILPLPTHVTALQRALGLAHHWQRLLDEQRASSIAEIADAEGIDVTQVRRLLRLTLLAPQIIGQLECHTSQVLEGVLNRPWPLNWQEQSHILAAL